MENKLHHANVVLKNNGGRDFVLKLIKENLNFEILANPDFFVFESESFGIDDARILEKWSIGKPISGDIKISFLSFGSITFEAQNALLKVFEEPPLGTYFFVCVENLGGFLPTFMSRVRVLSGSDYINNEKENIIAKKFINSDINNRFSVIKNMIKKEDKSLAKEFIKDLESVIYKKESNDFNIDNREKIKNILVAKTFINMRGSSSKMLLEWLSSML